MTIEKIRVQMAKTELAVNLLMEKSKVRAQKLLWPIFNAYFKKHPEVTAIRWQQYTPYFNDGDGCVFRVRDLCVEFTNEFRNQVFDGEYSLRTLDEEKWWDGDIYRVKKDSILGQKAVIDFKSFVASIKQPDLLLAVFGDHVRIEASPTGFNVQKYNDHG